MEPAVIEDAAVSAVKVRREPLNAQVSGISRAPKGEGSALERPQGPLERHTVTSVTRTIDLVLESLDEGHGEIDLADDNVAWSIKMMQNAYMGKEAAVTIRIPVALKRRLETRAQRERRSLSAQAAYELERALEQEPAMMPAKTFLGRYEGARIPTDDDIQEVRRLLWGRLKTNG